MDSPTNLGPVVQPAASAEPVSASGRASRFAGWLRDPSWLTPERMAFYSGGLLLAYLIAAIGQLIHSHNLIFESGLCVGGDFVDFYAASVAALGGHPAAVYDVHLQHIQMAKVMGGRDFGVLVFSYPPTFLLMVLPLSLLPFVASWVAFETVTLGGYFAVLRRIAPNALGCWLAIAFPGVIINFMCGQNGSLSAALVGGGLVCLERRPILAGFLFGLMAYKPHLAVLVPLALIASRQWRALIATGASGTLFSAVSLTAFGPVTWRAFFNNFAITQKLVLDRGGIHFNTLQSIFGAVMMWGGSLGAGYAAQVMYALIAGAAVIWVWRGERPFAVKAASLSAGCLMVSPYLLQYDLVLLALPVAWLAMEGFEKGFLPYEKAVLVISWLLPRISLPVALMARIPLAPLVIVVLLGAILRRAGQRESVTEQPRALHRARLEASA